MIHIKHPKTTVIPAWLMWIIYGDSAPITAIFATWIVLDRNLIVQHAITRPRYCPMKSLFGSPLSPLPEKKHQIRVAKASCQNQLRPKLSNRMRRLRRHDKYTKTTERPGNRPSVLTSFYVQPLFLCFENVNYHMFISSMWLFCIAVPVRSMKNALFTAVGA